MGKPHAKMKKKPPKVLISYSHDSEAHKQQVLALAERLRKDGVDAHIDQYVNGSPKEGWPRWMLNQIEWADFILLVCTESYYSCFRGHEKPVKGKGADWEGVIITNEIYNARSKTTKFVPILFSYEAEKFIPEPFAGYNYYLLNSETNYRKLYDFLTGQAGVQPSKLGSIRRNIGRKTEALIWSEMKEQDSDDFAVRNNINGDILFQLFAQAPVLSRHIRVREFQTLVAERTRRFVGRDFIVSAIDDLLREPTFLSGYIVINGEPGIGKTALVAQLVKQRGYIHHFNIASQNIRSASDFLANVCAQLIVRHNLKYLALPSEATKDSGFLSKLLAEVADKKENQPVVILIDALDEVEERGVLTGENRLYLPQALPDGVFFVVTKREEHDDRLFVDRRKDIYLRDDDSRNLKDVSQHIRGFIEEYRVAMTHRIEEWRVTEEEFVDTIIERSEGNFMYLIYVLGDIRVGKLTITNVDDIRKLPQGLKDYYQRHWRAMRMQDIDRFDKNLEPVVCILATVREPVTIGQVAEWTKLTPKRVKEAINEWREFLNVEEAEQGEFLYRIYHTSFQDFLKDEVGLTRYHDRIVQTALDKIPGFNNGAKR